MGILAGLLGNQNPVAQWAAANHGWLSSVGAGLAQGPTLADGLANAARLGPAGQLIDQQYQKDAQDKSDREAKIKQASADLAKFPDLVKYVTDTGDTAGAFGEMFKRTSPGYGDPNYGKAPVDPTSTYAGRLQAGKEQGLTGTELGNYALTGNLPEGAKQAAPPVGYQWGADGNLAFIPGGPADPSTAGKTTEATRRNQQLATVIEPEVQSLMGDGTKPGTFDALANGWDQARDAGGDAVRVLGQGPSPAYQQAKNSLKTIIASYLYSVSGATANPGEVENQASVLTPRPGEDPNSIADKKRRIQVMVDAVRAAATGKPINIDGPSGGIDDLLTKYGVQ